MRWYWVIVALFAFLVPWVIAHVEIETCRNGDVACYGHLAQVCEGNRWVTKLDCKKDVYPKGGWRWKCVAVWGEVRCEGEPE